MKISGAIFDMDGTLLDSMAIWKTMSETSKLADIQEQIRTDIDSLREQLKSLSDLFFHTFTDIIKCYQGRKYEDAT